MFASFSTFVLTASVINAGLCEDREPWINDGGAGALERAIDTGRGVFPVGAQARRYYARPDVAYIPFSDAPPLEWGLMWRADGATARVRAFSQAADDLVHGHP